ADVQRPLQLHVFQLRRDARLVLVVDGEQADDRCRRLLQFVWRTGFDPRTWHEQALAFLLVVDREIDQRSKVERVGERAGPASRAIDHDLRSLVPQALEWGNQPLTK